MTQKYIIFPMIAIVSLAALVLAACGGADDSEPVPTIARLEDLAAESTGTAIALLPPATATLPPSETPRPTDTLTPSPTLEPSPTDTPQPSPTETPAPSATPTEDPRVQAIMQTGEAVIQVTQTAVGMLVTLTPTSEAPDFTAEPTLTATLEPGLDDLTPPENFSIIYYTNRNGSDDVYLLGLDGSESPMLLSLANEREPSCAPAGSDFVFASDASGSFQIYRRRFANRDTEALTNSAGMNFAPVYSPDGSTIAFVSTRNGGVPTIWLMDADGGNQRQLTLDLGRDTSPAWGPDARQLLFANEQTGPWDLYLTILEEGVEGEFPVLPPELSAGNQLWPVFDTQGERIAYTQWGDLNDPQTGDIYMLDFELPAPVAVREADGADLAWDWADAGHLLASVGGPDDVQIALVDVATGDAERLTSAGTFNGGARRCIVPRDGLVPDKMPPPTLTPTQTPTVTPTEPPTTTPTPTLAPSPTPQVLSPELEAAQGRTHIVQEGDNLLAISNRYGVPAETVIALNSLGDPNTLTIGQRLIIPVTQVGPFTSGPQHPDMEAAEALEPEKTIVVSIDKQRLYAKENGRTVRTILVSTGSERFPTVEGDFSVYWKLESQDMSGPGYYVPDVPWVMYFYRDYGLHGAYWHNNFGQQLSHGCVNLPVDEAEWLFKWAEVGTPVSVGP